ncbi:uncharacterized protein LOC132272739 [Cornus florida]|uniref:uncharacterized protein LOC132272739 n=1 Tax=Cornus florida TaxID=4283 RepID=UPI00289A0D2D|nr:uncharacterized protein LOC132272739 [Cornus florida]
MGPEAFQNFCELFMRDGGLRPIRHASIEEQVAKFLHIISHNVRNRTMSFFFCRSGETISRHFHSVLKVIISLEGQFLKQPNGLDVLPEILNNDRFHPYFKNCIGAIDGTHVHVRVSNEDAPRYRGKKNYPTINVLAVCSFDMKFTYVLPGWEGTASNSRVLASALERNGDKLKLPQGKYYLVDAGYLLKTGLITPYRGSSTEPTHDVNTQVDIILMGMDPNESLINEVDRELLNETRNEKAGPVERSEDHSLEEYLRDSINIRMSKESSKSGVSKKDRLDWNAQMDDIFVDALHNQYLKGNMLDGTFTTRAYHEIVEELKQKLGIDINKDKVKNRLKTTKTRFNECFNLFKNDLSGFAWSQETKMWSTEPKVWADLIAVGFLIAKPAAEKWKTATIFNYDKLLDLFAKDRAMGFNALTAKEMMDKWAVNDKENNNESVASASERSNEWVPTHNDDLVDSIYGIDHLVSRNEASLDNTGFFGY